MSYINIGSSIAETLDDSKVEKIIIQSIDGATLSFPKNPSEELENFIILKTPDTFIYNSALPIYALMQSNQPFLSINGKPVFQTQSNWEAYQTITESIKWLKIELQFEDDQYVQFPEGWEYVWSNKDVLDSETDEVIYIGTEPIILDGAKEPVGVALQSNKQICFKNSEATPLVCLTVSPDGGKISYEWHRLVDEKDGGIVNETDGKLESGGAKFIPSTELFGEKQYYCLITNSLNDTRTTIYSQPVTIKTSLDAQAYLLGYLTALTLRGSGEDSLDIIQKALFDINSLRLKSQDNYYLFSR